MASIRAFEVSRLQNISRNQTLLDTLVVNQRVKCIRDDSTPAQPARKRRKFKGSNSTPVPSRSSVRLASAPSRPVYDANEATGNPASKKSGKKSGSPRPSATVKAANTDKAKHKPTEPVKNLEAIQQSWTSWQPVAPPPIRDEAGVFHFKSHGEFTPNKSPEEMLREGCFGGSYFRPLYSKHLDTTVSDDYKEIPASWIDGLNVDLYLTSPTYDPEINKFKVTCGQSIEQWELAGWINHTYDVRGWFQQHIFKSIYS